MRQLSQMEYDLCFEALENRHVENMEIRMLSRDLHAGTAKYDVSFDETFQLGEEWVFIPRQLKKTIQLSDYGWTRDVRAKEKIKDWAYLNKSFFHLSQINYAFAN